MGRLAEIRGRRRERQLGPKRVNRLLPVESPPRSQREQLDELGRPPVPPGTWSDRSALDADLEGSQEANENGRLGTHHNQRYDDVPTGTRPAPGNVSGTPASYGAFVRAVRRREMRLRDDQETVVHTQTYARR